MRAWLIPAIVTGFLCLYSAGAEAQIYRWVDKQGNVNYTSTPPQERARTGPVTTIGAPSSPPEAPAGASEAPEAELPPERAKEFQPAELTCQMAAAMQWAPDRADQGKELLDLCAAARNLRAQGKLDESLDAYKKAVDRARGLMQAPRQQ